jgi:hypothetical protein
MDQVSTSAVKRSNRRKPLGFAYSGLILFMVVYFARPEDWIPGLAAVPLARITAILILAALVFSFGDIRWHMPLEVTVLILLVIQLWLAAVSANAVCRGLTIRIGDPLYQPKFLQSTY